MRVQQKALTVVIDEKGNLGKDFIEDTIFGVVAVITNRPYDLAPHISRMEREEERTEIPKNEQREKGQDISGSRQHRSGSHWRLL